MVLFLKLFTVTYCHSVYSETLPDLVLLDDDLSVKSTFILGEEVWRQGP